MIGWVIGIVILGVIVYMFMKGGVEINLEKRYWMQLWQLVALFMLGFAVGLWLPW